MPPLFAGSAPSSLAVFFLAAFALVASEVGLPFPTAGMDLYRTTLLNATLGAAAACWLLGRPYSSVYGSTESRLGATLALPHWWLIPRVWR